VEANRSEPQTMTEIDHVAIAVRDLDAAIEWYGSALGARIAHRERVERDGVEEALLCVAESYIQLLCPTAASSRWRDSWSAKEKASTMSATGGRLCRGTGQDASRRRSADRCIAQGRVAGTTVAFVHPRSAFGTLIELVQE